MIGQKLGSFRIEAELGIGAMGAVYRGVNETTGRSAAIKVVAGDYSQKSGATSRFQREADILKQFRHPNIVRFLAVGRYQGTSYFAMEYIAGRTLEQVLDERGALPWLEVVEMGIQLCDALHYAHEHGVVHRDLKPSNLMISESGQLKLTDFGIAKDLDATALTATGRTLGTAAYMAPEQIRGTPEISHKTDLYALGIVLYQMLTGDPPFTGQTVVVLWNGHLTEPPPRASAKVLEIPVALDDLIVKLMAKAPADRPWDAAAVGLTLSEIRDKATRGDAVAMVWPTEERAPARLGAPKPRKKAKGKSKSAGWHPPWLEPALLALALLAVIGFLGYMFWPPSEAYLYAQASTLMASKNPEDWKLAQTDYLNPLDERFPKNPYQRETGLWRDRILLEEVKGRAGVLEGGIFSPNPNEVAEALYVGNFKEAAAALKEGRTEVAARIWRDMARHLESRNDPKDRRWILLARHRADDLFKASTLAITRALDSADESQMARDFVAAVRKRRAIVRRYAAYPEFADLVKRARAGIPPDFPDDPAPASRPPEPRSDENPGL